uniref:C2 domain-containing protein n=1 Tax=Entomoneis paludosa TaxID=265537 RepID=A0A7S2YNZ6_9STRA|mmetsp:Transcript_40606/g.84517  ORF Transcript_40606/g.84517 Transcript_40606/m.84517 type:complete len:192 (+) Transcript_40606:3-578(+)
MMKGGAMTKPYIMTSWNYHAKIRAAETQNAKKGGRKTALFGRNKADAASWPRVKHQRHTLNPNYGNAEINLIVNGPVGSEGMLFVTVMDYDIGRSDEVMGTLPMNLRDLVNFASTSAPLKSSRKRSASSNNNNKSTIALDLPLIKNGKHCGRIQFTMDVERIDSRISAARQSQRWGFLQRFSVMKRTPVAQ